MGLLMYITECSQRSCRWNILIPIVQRGKLGLRVIACLTTWAVASRKKQLQDTLRAGPILTGAGQDPNCFTYKTGGALNPKAEKRWPGSGLCVFSCPRTFQPPPQGTTPSNEFPIPESRILQSSPMHLCLYKKLLQSPIDIGLLWQPGCLGCSSNTWNACAYSSYPFFSPKSKTPSLFRPPHEKA